MDVEPLAVDGAYLITPRQFSDDRGVFLEGYRGDRLAEILGYEPRIVQANVSVSCRGTVRGVHFADVPPSQAKYVSVLSGRLLDVVVDLRLGSPTFGQHVAVELDAIDRRSVYLSEGLGHALVVLEDDTTVHYLCTEPYTPDREHGIHPLDPEVGLPVPDGLTPLLSPKDSAAPTLAEARSAGLLPTYDDCRAWTNSLRA